MKICAKCGSQNPDINSFCSSCGQSLEAPIAPQQVQQTSSSPQCQITFNRIKFFYGALCKFYIKVDNSASYELSNGSSVTVPMSLGEHSVEISVFANSVKTNFNFEAKGDMTFSCKTNSEAFFSPLAKPVTVTDSNGKIY